MRTLLPAALLVSAVSACAPAPVVKADAPPVVAGAIAAGAAEGAAAEDAMSVADQAATQAARAALPPAGRGLAFARDNCAGCHAVSAPGVSPNPEAPPFDTIVAAPGLTAQTLTAFLRDSHSFPGAMDFAIDRDAIDDLARYMMTLRPKG